VPIIDVHRHLLAPIVCCGSVLQAQVSTRRRTWWSTAPTSETSSTIMYCQQNQNWRCVHPPPPLAFLCLTEAQSLVIHDSNAGKGWDAASLPKPVCQQWYSRSRSSTCAYTQVLFEEGLHCVSLFER